MGMEQKVEALEAAAEVSADMGKNAWNRALAPSSSKKEDASDIELQFRMLESSGGVEKDLEKLKSKILPPSASKKSTSKKSIATKKIAIEDLDRMHERMFSQELLNNAERMIFQLSIG